MQFYYGEKNIARVMDEIEFWKHQEAEHTVVIRQMAPNLEPRFVIQLQQFEQVFHQTQGMAARYTETLVRSRGNINSSMQRQMTQFVEHAIEQSKQFIMLLNQILSESEAVRANPAAGVLIHHIIRESEYFIGIAQTVLNLGNNMR